MVFEAKQRAAKVQADNLNMQNAARNVRICELAESGELKQQEIADRVGVSRFVVRRVVPHGLEYWREWLEKAVAAGIGEDAPPANGAVPNGIGIQMIPLDDILPNPYQPRKTVLLDSVDSMARSIATTGLRHPITVRPYSDSRSELGLGQLRLLAFKRLRDGLVHGIDLESCIAWQQYVDETGAVRIPAIVTLMTDEELVIAALAENMQRASLTWLDETQALKAALAFDGIRQVDLAQSVGIAPSHLSDRLRLLALPEPILMLVNKGKLNWTTARSLLGFVGKDHTHEPELLKLADWMERSPEEVITASRLAQRIDQTLADVQTRWRPVTGYAGHKLPRPVFDFSLGSFEEEFSGYIHKLPLGNSTGRLSANMTCHGRAWDRIHKELYEEREAAKKERFATLTPNGLVDEPAPSRPPSDSPLGPNAEKFSRENLLAHHLPEEILEMLDSGKLSEAFVERLLSFVVGNSHTHKEHLDDIAEGLSNVGIGDLRLGDAQAGGVVLRSLQKELAHWQFHSLDDRLTRFGFESPRFAVDKFIKECKPTIHTVPIGIGLVRVTCNTRMWKDWQQKATASTAAQVERASSQPTVAPVSETAAQLQDMAMADIPKDELAAQPAREVSNCAHNLKRKESHWHVEWNATRGIWLKQSPAFLDYAEAVAYLKNAPDDVEAVIVRHIYH